MPTYVSIERNFNPNIIIARHGKVNPKIADRLRSDVGSYLNYYGLEAIKRYFPKGGKGILEGSLKVYDESLGYHTRWSIRSNNKEYEEVMKILEYGSPPHTITPSQAEALAFRPHLLRMYWGKGGLVPMAIWGDQIFRARVEHPGNRAYRMFQQGTLDISKELPQVVRSVIKSVVVDIMREK